MTARNATQKKDAAVTGSTVKTIADYDDQDLTNLSTWDDLSSLLAKHDVSLIAADKVLGDGFQLLNDKRKLVGVELVILEWRHNDSDKGSFTSARVVAKADNGSALKYIVNDGGTGLDKELRALTAKGMKGGLHVKRGLTVSDYDYTDPNTGVVTPATTYYLDTSA